MSLGEHRSNREAINNIMKELPVKLSEVDRALIQVNHLRPYRPSHMAVDSLRGHPQLK